jgi:XTP/dITP diphosphohydrolase
MSVGPRQIDPGRLIIASHNPGKVVEISALILPYNIVPVSAAELNLAEPEETGTSFKANAELKAKAAAIKAGGVALADDSGLMVDALGGAPGIYSARWAGPGKDFGHAMQKIEDLLQEQQAHNQEARRAHFICALCLAWPDGHVEHFEGRISGTLVWPLRGNRGFGYDPMFQPNGHSITFGEMDPDAKHAMSHRARAFEKMKSSCLAHD